MELLANKLTTIAKKCTGIYETGYEQGQKEAPSLPSQDKDVTPSMNIQEIVADEGHSLAKVTVNSISAATDLFQQKVVTPDRTYQDIRADSGKILESVGVGPIPAEYIIPEGDMPIIENGEYDVRQYASVTVQVAGSGGGSASEVQSFLDLIMNDATDFEDTRITKLSKYAFAYRTNIKTISLPNLTSSAERAFSNCNSMTSLSIPNMRNATQTYAFAYCGAMTSCDVKQASSISTYAFYGCSALVKIEFDRITSIAGNAFASCTKLATLILRSPTMVSLSATTAFTSTKIAGSGGYIYVPSALIEEYKVATNWSTYASKFRAIEDYPDITGG